MNKAIPRGEDVFQRMLAKIYACELAPGEIINESTLALEFGVSRGPVREAVRRLQGIQLVTREPYLRARVVTLTPQAMFELFQMREAIEGYCCTPGHAHDQRCGAYGAVHGPGGGAEELGRQSGLRPACPDRAGQRQFPDHRRTVRRPLPPVPHVPPTLGRRWAAQDRGLLRALADPARHPGAGRGFGRVPHAISHPAGGRAPVGTASRRARDACRAQVRLSQAGPPIEEWLKTE